jgi:predicted DNA-binding transcriptional regulator YafY
MVSLEDAWIKAAVEHKTIEIRYCSNKTKGEVTVREVEPDFFGSSRNGKNFGCWGLCRLRGEIRCFSPESILEWRYVGDNFEPNPVGRWQELLAIYEQRKLNLLTL